MITEKTFDLIVLYDHKTLYAFSVQNTSYSSEIFL